MDRAGELDVRKKFVLALIAYAILAILAMSTLSNQPIRIFDVDVQLRTATLLILGLFAFRAALYYWRTRLEKADEEQKPAGPVET
ncbi:MAG TPA: hypothetical protein VMH85_20315 [Terriglobales bacterium]|nr:hypothetical protein [Terriglobales bacterium]